MNLSRGRCPGLCGLVVAVVVLGAAATVAASSQALGAAPGVARFPQHGAPNYGSGLTRVGHSVFFETTTPKGNTRLGRVRPNGHSRYAAAKGSAYGLQRPIKTTDGAIWMAMQRGGGGGRAASGLGVAGLDRSTWVIHAAVSSAQPLYGFPSVADRSGRFWAQGNGPGKGLVAVGDGLGKSLVAVQTHLGPLSSETDITVNNPMILGPDGHVWMLGGDGTGAGLRVTSVGPKGIRVDLRPAHLGVGTLALTAAAGKVWSVGTRRLGGLTAVGVDPHGAITRVRTPLETECQTDAAKPKTDGHGGLWFTGGDARCSAEAALLLSRVDVHQGTASTVQTGLTVLGNGVSTVVPVTEGVVAAGLDSTGHLAFARVGAGSPTVLTTRLQPWLSPAQARYPMVSDKKNGAWAQAVNAQGHLLVVHVTAGKVITIATGLTPVARELTVGPDKSLWTTGLSHGHLVAVKVHRNDTLIKYPTGLAPTQLTLKPKPDKHGHMWFQASNANTGNLVMLRVPANQ